MTDYDFNILYYIDIYKKWWKKILTLIVVSIFLTAYISVLIPVRYVSTVSILLVETGGISQAAGVLGKFFGLSGQVGSSSSDIIISILKSRRMANDIKEAFHLNTRPRFRYSIETRQISAGMAIDVKGNDPALVKDIANFVVKNLDKINTELDITPVKPMVKVLDPATDGVPESRQLLRKVFVAGLFSFLLVSLYAFFEDYLKKLKSNTPMKP